MELIKKKKDGASPLNGSEARKKCHSLMQLVPDYTIVLFLVTQEDYGKKLGTKRRLWVK